MNYLRPAFGFFLMTGTACGAATAPESAATPAATTTSTASAATTNSPPATTAATATATAKTSAPLATTAPAGRDPHVPAGCGKAWESVVGQANTSEWDEAGSLEPGMEPWIGLWTDGQPGKCEYALAFVEIEHKVHVWFSPCEGMFTSLVSPLLSKNGFGVEGNLGGSAGRVALQLKLGTGERAEGTLAVMLPAGAEMGGGENKITFTRVCH